MSESGKKGKGDGGGKDDSALAATLTKNFEKNFGKDSAERETARRNRKTTPSTKVKKATTAPPALEPDGSIKKGKK